MQLEERFFKVFLQYVFPLGLTNGTEFSSPYLLLVQTDRSSYGKMVVSSFNFNFNLYKLYTIMKLILLFLKVDCSKINLIPPIIFNIGGIDYRFSMEELLLAVI